MNIKKPKNLIHTLCLFAILFFMFQSNLNAADETWEGTLSDFWGVGGNWGNGTVPLPADNAIFTLLDDGGVTDTDNATIAGLNINAGSHQFQSGLGPLTATTISVATTGTTTFNDASLQTGALTKTATGSLLFDGANTLTSITHNAGTISLFNGSNTTTNITQTGGSLITGISATVTGNYDVQSGTVSPNGAGAFGTLNVTQTFTLGADGTYFLEIGPAGQTDLISAANVVLTEGNTVSLNPSVGVYTIGTTYDIIRATVGLVGTVTNLEETHELSFSTSIEDETVVLTIDQNAIIAPVSVLANNGNANDIAITNYVNGLDANNPIALSIAGILLENPNSRAFLNKARKIAPFQNGMSRFIRLLNSSAVMENALGRQLLTYCDDCDPLSFEQFLAPIFLYSHADLLDHDKGFSPGFDNYAEGFTYGLQKQMCENALRASHWQFDFAGALSYLHSKAFFYTDRGSTNQNSLYVSASTALRNPIIATAFQFFVQYEGGGSKVSRVINLQPDFTTPQIASSQSWSNALLFGCDGLLNPRYVLWQARKKKKRYKLNTLSVAPQAGVYSYFLWSCPFKETGAGSYNLSGKSEQATWIVPNAKLNIVQELQTEVLCIKPGVYAGWSAYIPLKANNVTSQFTSLGANASSFTINVNPYDHRYINQFLAGFELAISKCETYLFEIHSEVKLFDNVTALNGGARLQFNF